ncbi:hypothetical protein DFJ58DRAFT_722505 [Suillus subalutaceus]|uniref:uncharacterized protein n=1 Tax=Suillus subalutaceus TaxID=48586 RepID=UPI001B8768E4|nr:uncharacterized protein DFJ58DRAFT_722505 [Suillus subalutaceus]KAG1871760.1 hypothetical protein DFJ58DRAFT_722505 [Suillus subalutaceus]
MSLSIQFQQVLKAFTNLDFILKESKHVILRAATGSGKTLCMILPLLLSSKMMAIMVTPLKSLQKDHVKEFEEYGICSITICFVNRIGFFFIDEAHFISTAG